MLHDHRWKKSIVEIYAIFSSKLVEHFSAKTLSHFEVRVLAVDSQDVYDKMLTCFAVKSSMNLQKVHSLFIQKFSKSREVGVIERFN